MREEITYTLFSLFQVHTCIHLLGFSLHQADPFSPLIEVPCKGEREREPDTEYNELMDL